MILLDTNYLILGLVADSREAGQLTSWAGGGEELAAAAVVWYEFLSGPVNSRQVAAIAGLVRTLIPFDDAQAETAARLWNAAGRRRTLRVDAMIAAAAIHAQATLATGNREDFEPFAALGLRLAE